MAITNDDFQILLQSAVAGTKDLQYKLYIEELRWKGFVVAVDDIEGSRLGRFLVSSQILAQQRPEDG